MLFPISFKCVNASGLINKPGSIFRIREVGLMHINNQFGYAKKVFLAAFIAIALVVFVYFAMESSSDGNVRGSAEPGADSWIHSLETASDEAIARHDKNGDDTGSTAAEHPLSFESAGSSLESRQGISDVANYRSLIARLQTEETDKIALLNELWRLAPEVGIDDELMALLALESRHPDSRVAGLSAKILSDLNEFRNGIKTPVESLVDRIQALDARLSAETSDERPDEGNFYYSDSGLPAVEESSELSATRAELINQLSDYAVAAEDAESKKYALIALVKMDNDKTLEVIEYHLFNSSDTRQRMFALEVLESLIGDYDTEKVREIFSALYGDRDRVISEKAREALINIDRYLQTAEDTTP
jgi:uncharacterized protein YuzB (UPF0349 family)